jgi:hypothetical protein
VVSLLAYLFKAGKDAGLWPAGSGAAIGNPRADPGAPQ